MSLDITMYRVVTNGIASDTKAILDEEETKLVSKYFSPYVKYVGETQDEWGNEYKNASSIEVNEKATIGFTIFTYPKLNDDLLEGGLYLFKWQDVQRYYEEGLTDGDYRKQVFKEQFLDRFKEGKDFIYFQY